MQQVETNNTTTIAARRRRCKNALKSTNRKTEKKQQTTTTATERYIRGVCSRCMEKRCTDLDICVWFWAQIMVISIYVRLVLFCCLDCSFVLVSSLLLVCAAFACICICVRVCNTMRISTCRFFLSTLCLYCFCIRYSFILSTQVERKRKSEWEKGKNDDEPIFFHSSIGYTMETVHNPLQRISN